MSILQKMFIPQQLSSTAANLTNIVFTTLQNSVNNSHATRDAFNKIHQEQFNGQNTANLIALSFVLVMTQQNPYSINYNEVAATAVKMYSNYLASQNLTLIQTLPPDQLQAVQQEAEVVKNMLGSYYASANNQQPQPMAPNHQMTAYQPNQGWGQQPFQQPMQQQGYAQPPVQRYPQQNVHQQGFVQSQGMTMNTQPNGMFHPQQTQQVNPAETASSSRYAKRPNSVATVQAQPQPASYQPQPVQETAAQPVKATPTPVEITEEDWQSSERQSYKLLVKPEDTAKYTLQDGSVIMELDMNRDEHAAAPQSILARFSGVRSANAAPKTEKAIALDKANDDLSMAAEKTLKAKELDAPIKDPTDLRSDYIYDKVIETDSVQSAINTLVRKAQTDNKSMVRSSVVVNTPYYGDFDLDFVTSLSNASNAEMLAEFLLDGKNSTNKTTKLISEVLDNDLTNTVNKNLKTLMSVGVGIESFCSDITELRDYFANDLFLKTIFDKLISKLVISFMSKFSKEYNEKLLKEHIDSGEKETDNKPNAVFIPEVMTITYVDATLSELGMDDVNKAPMSFETVKEPRHVVSWYLPKLHLLLENSDKHAENYRDGTLTEIGMNSKQYLVTSDRVIVEIHEAILNTRPNHKEFLIS